MKILILFSGTHSIEKVYNQEEHDIKSLDFDKKFNPTFNVDILTWKYEQILKDWTPDYIHSSPVCKEFSNLKTTKDRKRDMGLGMSLLTKSLEIIEYVRSLNSNLLFTIENPKGLMRKQECMKKYKRFTCSYCMYGFLYNKPTDFWSNMNLKLKLCRRTKDDKNWCDSMRNNKLCRGKHYVRIGRESEGQLVDWKYFKELKKIPKYKKYSRAHFRYRIPSQLCENIKEDVITHYKKILLQSKDKDKQESNDIESNTITS